MIALRHPLRSNVRNVLATLFALRHDAAARELARRADVEASARRLLERITRG